jgi:two-component system phosphate regulon sensor histidine kinase PhoR
MELAAAAAGAERLRRLQAEVRDHETVRRAAEARARRLERVLDSLDHATVAVDRFGEVKLVSGGADPLLAVARDAAIGRKATESLRNPALVEALQSALDAATGPDAAAVNRRLELDLGADGSQRPFEVRLATLREERGDGVLAVASARDLTAERELARLKNEFVSQASHELRTPLASLRAYLEMISDGEAASEAERADFLRIATEETERLSRLLDNMLNISRIESGLRHIDRTAVDLTATARRAVEALEGQARAKSILLAVRTAPVDCTVDGDADLLLEVMQNLVSNAIKYTPEGGRVAVGVDTDPLTRSVVASVTDTGLGIPPDAMPRLFDKFYRVENLRRHAKGTGLGLNLCKSIVEHLHGGQIGVESTVGRGSRFWFSVPVASVGRKAA